VWETFKAVWDEIGPLVGVIVGGGFAFVINRVQKRDKKEEWERDRRKEVLAQARTDVLGILAMHEKIMNRAAGAYFDLVHFLKEADSLEEVDKFALDKERELHALHGEMRPFQYSLEIAQIGDLHDAGLVVVNAAANPPLRDALEDKSKFVQWFEAAGKSRAVLALAAGQVFGSKIETADSAVPYLKQVYEKELERIKQAELEGPKDDDAA
jgi:hypothetical protein